MDLKSIVFNLFKLLVSGIVFIVGFFVGSMLASLLGLTAVVPEGLDPNTAMLALALSSPVVALGIALVAHGIGGTFWLRAAVLSFFTWIVYGLNTLLEATIVMPASASFWFNNVTYLVASVMTGIVVAFLFPAPDKSAEWRSMWESFWGERATSAWLWRLPLAAVVFMPIYYFFGLLAIQVTAPFYEENVAGLTAPTLQQLLPILFVRSVLFLVACLPILILWQKSERSLVLSLGAALFILVGFALLLTSTWLPMIVRVTHSLEILADEFVYAWVLVKLMGRRRAAGERRELRAQPGVLR